MKLLTTARYQLTFILFLEMRHVYISGNSVGPDLFLRSSLPSQILPGVLCTKGKNHECIPSFLKTLVLIVYILDELDNFV